MVNPVAFQVGAALLDPGALVGCSFHDSARNRDLHVWSLLTPVFDTHSLSMYKNPRKMATEDARYRQSSQFRLWSFSPSSLQELRRKTNSLATQQIAPRLAADPAPEPLSVDEEAQLVKFYTVELLRAAEFCMIPTDSRSTAAIFLRRFYVTNSIMTYPPTELLKTCLFFGCKADGVYYPLGQLAKIFPDTTGEQILAGEYLLCQGLRFAFDVRHPLRPLEGAILELRKRYPDEERRIDKLHAKTREILKFSPLMTDAYFHYTPSQMMMAAMLMVDADMVDRLLPPAIASEEADTARAEGIHSDMREKIMATIQACRAMLEEERPERMKDFWGVVSDPLCSNHDSIRDVS